MQQHPAPDPIPGWTRWILYALRAAMIVAAAVMLVLLVIGFAEILKSVLNYFVGGEPVTPGKTLRLEVMTSTVKSFELMLLAPLPFLLIAGLADYLRTVTGMAKGSSGKLLLTEAKALWVGLIVGVFATDLLDEALSAQIHYEQALSSAVIMLLLIGYFFGLEWLTHRERSEDAE